MNVVIAVGILLVLPRVKKEKSKCMMYAKHIICNCLFKVDKMLQSLILKVVNGNKSNINLTVRYKMEIFTNTHFFFL